VDGEPLTATDRSTLSDLIFSDRPGLSTDEIRAISFGLIDDQAPDRPASDALAIRSTPGAERAPPPAGAVSRDRRFLRVFNNTGERVKLWLQYNVPGDRGGVWVPADPAESEHALAYDLAPGRAYDLHNRGERVGAHRVRYWAVSPTRTWSRNATTDLVLGGAGDDADGHYFDTKVQTYTLALTADRALPGQRP
jgi:hypothetical protein